MSHLWSSTPVTCQTGCLGVCDLLLSGAPKIWYVVDRRRSQDFIKHIDEANEDGVNLTSLYSRRLKLQLPFHEARRLGIHRVRQEVGDTVYILSGGPTFYWTVSLGHSVSESCTFGHHDREARGAWVELETQCWKRLHATRRYADHYCVIRQSAKARWLESNRLLGQMHHAAAMREYEEQRERDNGGSPPHPGIPDSTPATPPQPVKRKFAGEGAGGRPPA